MNLLVSKIIFYCLSIFSSFGVEEGSGGGGWNRGHNLHHKHIFAFTLVLSGHLLGLHECTFNNKTSFE